MESMAAPKIKHKTSYDDLYSHRACARAFVYFWAPSADELHSLSWVDEMCHHFLTTLIWLRSIRTPIQFLSLRHLLVAQPLEFCPGILAPEKGSSNSSLTSFQAARALRRPNICRLDAPAQDERVPPWD